MRLVNNLTVEVQTSVALERLRKHRAEHAKIVAEAREGYVKKARKALSARLDELASGQLVSLRFSLEPPKDYTTVYDTAIEALSLHQGATIELTGQQVRNLMQDEWDWSDGFLFSNSVYSPLAEKISAMKGLIDD